MKIGDKCVIYPANPGDKFRPYVTMIKTVKNNMIEVNIDNNKHFKAGKNIVLEVADNNISLKRYKGAVRRTGKSSMVCVFSQRTTRDREFARVNAMLGVRFRLWSERESERAGLSTNLSANGMIMSTEATSYLGELISIDNIKLDEDHLLEESIIGRVIKFKPMDSEEEDSYHQMVITFLHINDNDRNDIIKYVNKKQKEQKEKGTDDELENFNLLDDFM